MLSDITIGRYIEKNSVLHRADSRVKIISALLYSICVVLADGFIALSIITALNILVILLSKISPKHIIKGIKPILWFVIFSFLMNMFFSQEGNTIWQWKVLQLTDLGIINAVTIALKLILFISGTSLLTLTTPPIALTDGLAGLMKPLKALNVPVDDIAMIISVSLRFIPTFADETEKILKAQRARGADFSNGGIIKKLKAVIPITIPLFISVFRHSDELALAMDSRCYGKGCRTPRKKLKFDKYDFLILSVMIIFCCFFVFIKIFD